MWLTGIFLRVCIWNTQEIPASSLPDINFSSQIHTSSLLGAEDADDETFLMSDTLSRSTGALDKPRVWLQKKCQLTAELLEQLSMCGVPRVWCVCPHFSCTKGTGEAGVLSGHS